MDELLSYASKLANEPVQPLDAPIKERIAYVVSHGQSYASNGYAIRTQGIARALNQHGLEVLCFVRPGRPWELNVESNVTPETIIDGVRYIHTRWANDVKPQSGEALLEASINKYLELFKVYRPSAVVAASNYAVGLPAWVAAKRLGLPFYNEVRGFWELSRAAREPEYENSSAFKKEAERDAFVAQQAKKVFTLNQPMKEELVKRGVQAENIAIVPNGVTKLPEIKPANPTLKKRLGIEEGEKVVGYVGSFNAYEGLDSLIDACAQLIAKGENIKLLLVGDDQPITEVVGEHTIGNQVENTPWLIQVGRVPHELIHEYYSLVNLVVIPRKNHPVCKLVQPTKFVEAASFNLPILIPSYCSAAVDDVCDNAVYFEEGGIAKAISSLLPYVYCGKYQDDNKYAYSFYYKVLPFLSTFIKGEEKASCFSDVELALDFVFNEKSNKLSKENERWLKDISAQELKNGNITSSLLLSRYAFKYGGDVYSLKAYVKSLFAAQKYDKVVEVVSGKDDLGSELEKIKSKSFSYLKLYKEYYDICDRPTELSSVKNKKSVYFLHSSLPYFSGGYATRAHGLASALLNRGLNIKPYTRPNFPYDVKKDITDEEEIVQVDGLTYTKTTCKSARLKDEASYMLDCVDVFGNVLDEEQPGYVHGRSTYQIALPALIASKKRSLPFVYEVSGLWEIVHESRDTAPQRKSETERIRHLETMTAMKADLVFTLTGAMKDELIARGVEGSKITILPNCTNPDKFLPREKSQSLLSKLGISKNIPVIGYIGSFQDYEGLDDLIVACEILSDRKPDLDYRLLLVGDGPYYKQICDQAEKSSVKNKIIITGRVPHSLASEYYSVVDIAPFPRKSWPVCEMVSPMKPLEALAMEKAVLVSSVKALSEMVIDNETGVVFDKGSIPNLSQALSDLIVDPVKRTQLGKSARFWVKKNRTWKEVSDIFKLSVFS